MEAFSELGHKAARCRLFLAKKLSYVQEVSQHHKQFFCKVIVTSCMHVSLLCHYSVELQGRLWA